ncbi:MAG: hypothetical protein WA208_20435 [Thermoanaerobaculia bacterium]
MRLLIAFVLVAGTIHAAEPPVFVVTQRLPLTSVEWPLDVRWTGGDSIAIAAGRAGVVQFELRGPLSHPKPLMGGDRTRTGSFYSQLAFTPTHLLAASPLGMVAWKRTRQTGTADGGMSVAMSLDVDAAGDSFVILGADRDAKNRWSPDGAIAWLGSLGPKPAALQPVLYSHVAEKGGTKAASIANCGLFGNGGVRFLEDGSFVVVPGVEPGAYLYDHRGKLVHTWQTSGLGFLDSCRLSMDQVRLYQRDVAAREEFLRRQPMLDDVVALGRNPGLLIRSYARGVVRWEIVELRRGSPPVTHRVEFESTSRVTHMKADLRGKRAVFLVYDAVDVGDPNRGQPSILLASRR